MKILAEPEFHRFLINVLLGDIIEIIALGLLGEAGDVPPAQPRP